jgi:hypothetical protein
MTSFLKIAAVLFVTHSVGYFSGGELFYWLHGPSASEVLDWFSPAQLSTAGMLIWGLIYGLGFGAGVGYTFFTAQNDAS